MKEKVHSTNYYNTLIEVAEDCTATQGEVPPMRGGKKSAANYQYEMLKDHPYVYTSDEVLFSTFAIRKEFPKEAWPMQQQLFFSKGQPCFRASPLTKRYGWGVHADKEGKIAICGIETERYKQLANDPAVEKTKAMRSKRK